MLKYDRTIDYIHTDKLYDRVLHTHPYYIGLKLLDRSRDRKELENFLEDPENGLTGTAYSSGWHFRFSDENSYMVFYLKFR